MKTLTTPQEKTVLNNAMTAANNISFRSATKLGKINGLRNVRDTLSGAQAYEVYEFQIEAGQLDLVLDSVTAHPPVMTLYARINRTRVGTNRTADFITQAIPASAREQKIIIGGLGAGTYYIGIGRSSSAHVPIDYRLSIHPRPDRQLIESEPNNSVPSAYNLGGKTNIPLVGQRLVHGHISLRDTADFYRFTLNQASYVSATLALEELGSRAVLEILDANRNQLKTVSIARPRSQGSVEFDRLPAGTYYAHIRPLGPTNTPYTLSLTGLPVDAGNFTIRMHRITALDDFETWRRGGSGEADFYYKVSIDGIPFTSEVFDEDDDREFRGTGRFAERRIQKVDIGKRIIPFSVSLFEKDFRNDDHADINPSSALKDLALNYDTLTGEISGQGISVQKEGQKITVQGNSGPKARITFEVNYNTLSTGEIDP
ncbi:MAG: hypothetical protein AAGC93_20170 [Cyanobacteria bacterium P01_F01_bin.53]